MSICVFLSLLWFSVYFFHHFIPFIIMAIFVSTVCVSVHVLQSFVWISVYFILPCDYLCIPFISMSIDVFIVIYVFPSSL
jgi:hypothetical protein